jgi:hypothetical protein
MEPKASPHHQGSLEARPGAPAQHFDRDIRNHIYSYLTFPPLHHNENSDGLAVTYRQAKQEAAEEGVRQLWMFLQDMKKNYKQETGHELRLPAHITSKTVLIGLQDLTIILTGPMAPMDEHDPEEDFELPICLGPLQRFAYRHLSSSTIHFTGLIPIPLPFDFQSMELAHDLLFSAFNTVSNIQAKQMLEQLTISYDYCDDKSDVVVLKGTRFDLNDQHPLLIRGLHLPSRRWPCVVYVTTSDEVGYTEL